jgi:hypothetical protein
MCDAGCCGRGIVLRNDRLLGPANSQQQLNPELFRPAICAEFNIDGGASTRVRTRLSGLHRVAQLAR